MHNYTLKLEYTSECKGIKLKEQIDHEFGFGAGSFETSTNRQGASSYINSKCKGETSDKMKSWEHVFIDVKLWKLWAQMQAEWKRVEGKEQISEDKWTKGTKKEGLKSMESRMQDPGEQGMWWGVGRLLLKLLIRLLMSSGEVHIPTTLPSSSPLPVRPAFSKGAKSNPSFAANHTSPWPLWGLFTPQLRGSFPQWSSPSVRTFTLRAFIMLWSHLLYLWGLLSRSLQVYASWEQ